MTTIKNIRHKTREGLFIDVAHMNVKHIYNTINLLKRTIEILYEKNKKFEESMQTVYKNFSYEECLRNSSKLNVYRIQYYFKTKKWLS